MVPQLLPAVNFLGADPGVKFNNFSPRVGLTYDLAGNGKTLARANYAMYWGQVGTGGISGQINPVTRVSVRYPWIDLNSDKFVQANEIQLGANGGKTPLAVTGNWDPNNPANPGTVNTVDPNYKNDRTDEFIVGIDREIGAGFGLAAAHLAPYGGFQFFDVNGLVLRLAAGITRRREHLSGGPERALPDGDFTSRCSSCRPSRTSRTSRTISSTDLQRRD
jgi:hypothetical protein